MTVTAGSGDRQGDVIGEVGFFGPRDAGWRR